VGGVGGDVVDGGVVRLHVSHELTGGGVPQLDVATAAPGNNDVTAREESESADPFLVSIVQRLNQPLTSQIPLLYAGVARSGEESVARYRETLDAVIVGRVKVHLGRDHTALVLRNVEHFDIVILGAGNYVVVSVYSRGSSAEAHNRGLMPS